MISNAILSWLWGHVGPLVDQIPVLEFNTDGLVVSILPYLRAALYFLPVRTFVAIFSLTLNLWLLRMAIAILHTIWKSLPIL